MFYFSADHDDSTSLTIYRGMTWQQWNSRQGTTRKGIDRDAQFYAGDQDVHAGDTDVYVAMCARNALTLTAMDSARHKYCWLSFTKDMDVANFYALAELGESDPDGGVVIETSLAVLREHGIGYDQNDLRVPWEQEISVDLSNYPVFPEPAVIKVHRVPYTELWRAASELKRKWGTGGNYDRYFYDF